MNFRTEIETNPKNLLFWIFRPIKIFMVKHSIRNAVWYFPDVNLIFYHVPKCAGVSILTALKERYKCINISKSKAQRLNNVFRFTFIRPEIERLESAYKFTMRDKRFLKKYHLKEDSDFNEWFRKAKNDFHLQSFKRLYFDVNFDLIGNLNNIDENWNNLLEWNDLPKIELKRLNVTNNWEDNQK